MQTPFLYLMRHGATEWNLQDRFNSRTETEILLNPLFGWRAPAPQQLILPMVDGQ